MLDDLSADTRAAIGGASKSEVWMGEELRELACDGCDHVSSQLCWSFGGQNESLRSLQQRIFGARFHCRICPDFDYCFMCKPFLAHLHAHDEWQYTRARRPSYLAEMVTMDFDY
jgi:hypothetical protein